MKDISDVIKKTEKIFRVIEEVTGEERLVTITSHPYGFEPADIPVLIDDLPFIAEGGFESADEGMIFDPYTRRRKKTSGFCGGLDDDEYGGSLEV